VFSSACSVDAESVPEPNPARCIDGASSTYTTSSLSSPSPGRSLQSGHPLGSAQVPLDAAVAGRKVTVAFSPADFPLRNCDLFSMSWHNPPALGCQLLLPVAASLPSGRVAPPRLDWLAASCGVEISCLQRPSIRAGVTARHPILYASFDESRKSSRRRPHLYDGVLRRPGNSTGRLHQYSDRGVTPHHPSAYPALSTAPAGITPVSRKRQSAMSNLRATATIPIRRKRLPPPPKRSRNQTLRALSG
jgi:hypothetical protein